MRKILPSLALFVAVALFAVSCVSGTESVQVTPRDDLGVDRHAPNFEVRTLAGDSTKLTDFEGKVVLLDFYATWCGYCNAAMPKVEDLQARYPDDLRVMVISNEDKAKLADFVRQRGYREDLFFHDFNGEAHTFYEVTAYPSTVIVGRDGHIKGMYRGTLDPERLERRLLEVGLARS